MKNLVGPELVEEAELEYDVAGVAARARELADASGLTRRELAKRMGSSSASTIQRFLTKAEINNMTVRTLASLARACGHKVKVTFEPIAKEGQMETTAPSEDVIARRVLIRRETWDTLVELAEALREQKGIEVSPTEVATIALEAGLAVVKKDAAKPRTKKT